VVAGGVAVPDGPGVDGLAGGCGAVEAQAGGDDRGWCLLDELTQGGDARLADREAELEDAPAEDLTGQWLAGDPAGK
jgi:hypothetical protein